MHRGSGLLDVVSGPEVSGRGDGPVAGGSEGRVISDEVEKGRERGGELFHVARVVSEPVLGDEAIVGFHGISEGEEFGGFFVRV